MLGVRQTYVEAFDEVTPIPGLSREISGVFIIGRLSSTKFRHLKRFWCGYFEEKKGTQLGSCFPSLGVPGPSCSRVGG